MKADILGQFGGEMVREFELNFSRIDRDEYRVRAYSFLSYIQNVMSELAEINQVPVNVTFQETDHRECLRTHVDLGTEYKADMIRDILCTFLGTIGMKCKCCKQN